MEELTYLRKKLIELREANNINQSDLANYLGISQNTYSDYELGKIKKIPLEKIIMIANYYEVSIDFLTGRTNVMNIEFSKSYLKKLKK